MQELMAGQMARPVSREQQEHDRRIAERARRALWRYEPLRASGSVFEVEVERGMVSLGGRVRTLALRHLAGQLVAAIEGVDQVDNQLIADPQVVRALADALAADPATRPHVLRVEASLGKARLAGLVPSLEVERKALEVARSSPLVAGVVSDLEIDPGVNTVEGEAPGQPSLAEVVQNTGAD